MGEFFEYWFKGFEKGIEQLPEAERTDLFAQCGKACSESYTRELYEDIWAKTKGISEFFQELDHDVEEVTVNEIENGKEYEVFYHKCLCDLYTKGYMTSGCLCECSRQSLLYNLNVLWPDKAIKVELIDSILRGGSKCNLRILVENK